MLKDNSSSFGEVVKSLEDSSPKNSRLESRRADVWDMSIRGVPVTTIAKIFDVTEDTIRRDLQYVYEKYGETLRKKTAVEHVADHLTFLGQLEKIAIQEACEDEIAYEIDEKTSVITKKKLQRNPEKVKLLTLALKTRESIIKLMLDTGIIDKEPQKLLHSIDSVTQEKEGPTHDTRTPEDIAKEIAELMIKGRKL